MADSDVSKNEDSSLQDAAYSTLKQELESLGIFVDNLPQTTDDYATMLQSLSEELHRLRATVAEQEFRISELEKLLKNKQQKLLNHYQ